MQRWARVLRPRFRQWVRGFTTHTHERVEIRCGSSGYVSVDLFNLDRHAPDKALMLHLPAQPTGRGTEAADLPDFLDKWPVASINYRWHEDDAPLQWPTPVHDTVFAYSWLVANLAPAAPSRRDIYVYGSYLGGSLATSLALTETKSHERFGVRGIIAYNGVYNWTMFLPEHRVHRPKKTKSLLVLPSLSETGNLLELRDMMPGLFERPVNLFDPFASPSLFFHNPGLLVPESFDAPSSPLSDMVTFLTTGKKITEVVLKAPRKAHLVFPPRTSDLKIPETLFLCDSPSYTTGTKRTAKKPQGHTFFAQVEELAEMMRRSIDKVELKERSKWDDEMDNWEAEALRRVQVSQLEEKGDFGLSEKGQAMALEWLEDRV